MKSTYCFREVVVSPEFGTLPVGKAPGEGGAGSLELRIQDNYYNHFLR